MRRILKKLLNAIRVLATCSLWVLAGSIAVFVLFGVAVAAGATMVWVVGRL